MSLKAIHFLQLQFIFFVQKLQHFDENINIFSKMPLEIAIFAFM